MFRAPYFIAEMSANHNGSLKRARAIVKAAKETGADAIKLQTYTPDTLTIDCHNEYFRIQDPGSPWYGRNLYELYKEAHMPWEWQEELFKLSHDLGITCFSTVYDRSSVDFLERLDCPFYKIASFEITDLAFIEYVAQTHKPIIMSTGMAEVCEIKEAVDAARSGGCKDLVLLKCVSAYPAPPDEMNLRTIPHMKELFQCQVGLSDHTLGIGVSLGAISLGAEVIERHMTLRREDGGPDSGFSLEPHEMKELVREGCQLNKALGHVSYGAGRREKASKDFRRSLFFVRDLKKGQVITGEDIRSIRPSHGLQPKFLPILIGRKAKKDIMRGTPVSWELVE